MTDKNAVNDYVYLLHAQGTNRFKIGHSQDPIRRQNAINNASSPFPIKLITCYLSPDAHNEEQKLHRAAVKEAKREKRKEKVPKQVKKSHSKKG